MKKTAQGITRAAVAMQYASLEHDCGLITDAQFREVVKSCMEAVTRQMKELSK